MTDTAVEAAEVEAIAALICPPTHRPLGRQELPCGACEDRAQDVWDAGYRKVAATVEPAA